MDLDGLIGVLKQIETTLRAVHCARLAGTLPARP